MIELSSGDTALSLAPDAGGSIAAFRWRGIDIMRPADPAAVAANDPLGMSAFPLVPYSNRIAHGRFRWEGRDIALPLNFGNHPHSIHGLGWQAPWAVEATTATSAVLRYDHLSGDWPWDFAATQHFTVSDTGLDYALTVTNLSEQPMPAGLGLHPYFPNPPETRLRVGLDGWWHTDAFVMPLAHVAEVRDDWSDKLRPVVVTDNVFSGLGGPIRLDWPTHALTITASANAGWLVVYAPGDDSVTAIEAVTHPTDALNTPGLHGIRVLPQGETMTLTQSYRVAAV